MVSASFCNFRSGFSFAKIFPTHTVTHTGKGPERAREDKTLPESGFSALRRFLYNCCHKAADFLRCVLLHILRYVCVDVQGELCGVVTQHPGDGFWVHAVLQRHRSEGPAEVVKPDEFLDASLF